MSFKVGLIALLMGGAMIGLVSYLGSRMSAMDEAYSDLIKRVDTSTISISTTARRAETYREAAFELLTETTDAGNARLLQATHDASAQVIEVLNKMKADLPERASEVGRRLDEFGKAFAACKPVVEYASTTTTPEDNAKAAQRMRAECNGLLQDAVASQLKLVDDMEAFSKAKADEQHDNAVAEIRTILILAVSVSLATIGLALALGIFGIARPLGELVALLQRMARGEAVEMTALGRKDEIGDTARGVEAVKQMLSEKARAEAETKVQQDLLSAQQRKAEMHRLADRFEVLDRKNRRDGFLGFHRTRGLGVYFDSDRCARAGSHHHGRCCVGGSLRKCQHSRLGNGRAVIVCQRNQPTGPRLRADSE